VRYLIGLGNYTACDDAIGVRVVEYVAAHGLERGFRAVDLGANSLNLIAYLVPETTAILLVDAAEMGLPPGEWRFFAPDEVETRKAAAGRTTHEEDALQVLALARQAGESPPPILFLGIQPKEIRFEIGLSPELDARLPEYAAAAIARLLEL
jgi:hydrogenase maturation protease